jgi:putative ABC transport system substrate-binding protein
LFAFPGRVRIGAIVSANKLPTEVAVAEMVPFGALLSYGPDFPDYFRRAATYTDKILKGAKPADLPVEQPSRFKLTINVKMQNRSDCRFHLRFWPAPTRSSNSASMLIIRRPDVGAVK